MPHSKHRVIGFCGLAGSGKSTAVDYLNASRAYTRIRFAGPLKDMMFALGLSAREIDGDLKEKPSRKLCGKTPREAMQWLGTEWGRDLIGPDFWVSAWKRRALSVLSAGGSIAADDVRFPNEAETIRSLGGIIVRIRRPNLLPNACMAHISERQAFEVDAVVENTGDLASFNAQLDRLLDHLAIAA